MHTKKKGHKVAVLLLGLALAVLLLVGAWLNWEGVSENLVPFLA